MNIAMPILAFALGTLMGSFFHTLALRYADGRMQKAPLKALFSRSRCPACGETISPLMLVPVIGFLVQKGKCARCGAPISPLYPAAEILYGAVAALFSVRLGASILTVNLYLLACVALCIAAVDMKAMVVPDSLVIAFALLSAYPVVLNADIQESLLGMAALFAVFIVILLVFPGSFGWGDVKFASAIGLFSGLEMSILVLEVALVSGAVIGVAYALKTRKGLRTRIPFAPFLTLGLIVSLLFGREILLVYYRLLF
ncbi:MAG: prepilin peptidase [Spirochaetes bacterium]|nr:prepilin peptidase [Spirochaetota bacterium]